jgi:hypothetical protein
MHNPLRDPTGQDRGVRRTSVVELIRPMRGGSHPWLVQCESGDAYVVKFRQNPQHVRVLANEMLAGQLAQVLQLPVAEPAVVELPPELEENACVMAARTNHQSAPFCAGRHFGSRFPGDPASTLVIDFLPDRLLRRVRNLPAAFLGGFVFDKWTCNCDGRQVIFCRPAADQAGGYEALLIDHGFCFSDGDWSFPDSPARSLYPRRLVYEGVRGLHSFEPYLSAIENLSASELDQCAREVPAEWCGGEPGSLNKLVDELFHRRRRVRQAVIDAKNGKLNPFPNWA